MEGPHNISSNIALLHALHSCFTEHWSVLMLSTLIQFGPLTKKEIQRLLKKVSGKLGWSRSRSHLGLKARSLSLVKSSLDAYMTLLHGHVTRHYIRSSETFRNNPLRTPSLVYYSESDVVAPPGPIESLMSTWRARGVPVSCRCWSNTHHVSHYLYDPRNYTA